MFQSSNHSPGEGYLSRQDLLADTFKYITEKFSDESFIDFYPKTYRLYNKQECNEFFAIAQTEDYKMGLLDRFSYRRKVIVEGSQNKIDAFEDRKLRALYKNGRECGRRTEKEIVQENIHNKLRLQTGNKFVYRAFLYIASYDPFVAYYKHGYVMKNREAEDMSFVDSVLSLDEFIKTMKKFHSEKGDYGEESGSDFDLFTSKTIPLVEESIRKTIFAFKDKSFKDSRGYQIFGLNYVVDSDFKPWLISVTNGPYFSSKNSKILENVIEHQFKNVNYRNENIINYLQEIKLKIDNKLSKDNFKF